ncbi:30S ribosomal protein S6 [Desulfofalx alkaliphila]|uniref:30S ribosomal protein S6 n=1 Tax=Desulfofalx alkaliphila TaxID=105483 RepID=UPI0004E14D66|nr:30S ribosomal protein S6 [Desulfofalx alkaliphila]
MRSYEVMFIIRPDLEEEATEAVVEKVTGLIEKQGGETVKVDKWGKRRLAYEINKLREGYYVVVYFKGTAQVADEMDRVLKITDEVIRHMIIRKEE